MLSCYIKIQPSLYYLRIITIFLYFNRSCLKLGGKTLLRWPCLQLTSEVSSIWASASNPTNLSKWCLERENRFGWFLKIVPRRVWSDSDKWSTSEVGVINHASGIIDLFSKFELTISSSEVAYYKNWTPTSDLQNTSVQLPNILVRKNLYSCDKLVNILNEKNH